MIIERYIRGMCAVFKQKLHIAALYLNGYIRHMQKKSLNINGFQVNKEIKTALRVSSGRKDFFVSGFTLPH